MSEFESVKSGAKKNQGNLGVARAIYEYTRMGYSILFPLNDSEKYDLVVDTGVGLKRVQVKTSSHRVGKNNDRFEVSLASRGGNTKQHTMRGRHEDDYDWLFALVDTGQCWSIPTTAFAGVATSLSVGSGSKYDAFEITGKRIAETTVTIHHYTIALNNQQRYIGFRYDGRVWIYDETAVVVPYEVGQKIVIENILIEPNPKNPKSSVLHYDVPTNRSRITVYSLRERFGDDLGWGNEKSTDAFIITSTEDNE